MNKGVLGYSISYIGLTGAYNFMAVYLLVYMTDCVYMSSSLASLIVSISLIAESLAGVVIGNMSDRCTSKMGRRRPFILVAAIMVPISLFLMFHKVEGSGPFVFAYYLSLNIIFRVFFSVYEIPLEAFGAEIATEYDERTILRTVSRFFAISGYFFAFIIPLWILDKFHANEVMAWQAIGVIFTILVLVTWMACVVLTKKYSYVLDKDKVPKDRVSYLGVLKSYLSLSKLPVMRVSLYYKIAFAIAYALFNVAQIYFFKGYLGFTNTQTTFIYYFTICVYLIATPFASKFAIMLGKAKQQMYFMLVGGVIGMVVFFIGGKSGIVAGIYAMAFAIVQTSFWQISMSFFYDIVEFDELSNGVRREGDVISFISIVGTLVTSAVTQLFGIIFETLGYDGSKTVQNDTVVMFLKVSYILVPSLCLLAGFWALKKNPVNKETFDAVKRALYKRERGESYEKELDLLKDLL